MLNWGSLLKNFISYRRNTYAEYYVICINSYPAICRRPSWTPETQPNNAVRSCFVEFLVFNSIYWKNSDPVSAQNRAVRVGGWETSINFKATWRWRWQALLTIIIISVLKFQIIWSSMKFQYQSFTKFDKVRRRPKIVVLKLQRVKSRYEFPSKMYSKKIEEYPLLKFHVYLNSYES